MTINFWHKLPWDIWAEVSLISTDVNDCWALNLIYLSPCMLPFPYDPKLCNIKDFAFHFWFEARYLKCILLQLVILEGVICNLQLATCNSQLATRNSQLATRNSQLADYSDSKNSWNIKSFEHFWNVYGKWSICSKGANVPFSITFSNTFVDAITKASKCVTME